MTTTFRRCRRAASPRLAGLTTSSATPLHRQGRSATARSQVRCAPAPPREPQSHPLVLLPNQNRSGMMLGTIIIIILVLALIGALPTWGHSRNWGYAPSGGLG